jgi:hypothetical protein
MPIGAAAVEINQNIARLEAVLLLPEAATSEQRCHCDG